MTPIVQKKGMQHANNPVNLAGEGTYKSEIEAVAAVGRGLLQGGEKVDEKGMLLAVFHVRAGRRERSARQTYKGASATFERSLISEMFGLRRLLDDLDHGRLEKG